MINALKSFYVRMKSHDKPKGYDKHFNVLDEYVKEHPSNQQAVDIFKDEWSCGFPGEFQVQVSGIVPAFADERVQWASEILGGFKDKRVLELGPLEGAHAYMLEKGGAREILSIEANKRAYVKCLITKEITGLRNTKIMLGDFNEYLKKTKESFDITFACGVLYHMLNPAETIERVSKVSNSIFIWSHYYDAAILKQLPRFKRLLGAAKEVTHSGFKHTLHEHFYLEFLSVPSFCGGSNPNSYWMTRDGMLDCLKHFGFKKITIGFDQPNHPGGPAMCVVGEK